MLTSRFGALECNSNWNQHVRLFQARRALPPDEPNFCAERPGDRAYRYFVDAPGSERFIRYCLREHGELFSAKLARIAIERVADMLGTDTAITAVLPLEAAMDVLEGRDLPSDAAARSTEKAKPAGAAPPPHEHTMNVVRDPKCPTVILYGESYHVSVEGAAFVAVLLTKAGEWVDPATFDDDGLLKGPRRDRIKASLPKAVRDLIEGKRGGGYRLSLA